MAYHTRLHPLGLTGAKVVIGMLLFAVAVASMVLIFRPDLGKPDEDNRAVHPAGFSIVPPLGWERERDILRTEGGRSQDALRFMPERKVGKQPLFGVVRLVAEPAQDPFPGFVDSTFLGKPAREFDGLHGGFHRWVVVFQYTDGNWYLIELLTPDPPGNKIGNTEWRAFFESFRVETPTRAPTTAPTLSTQ